MKNEKTAPNGSNACQSFPWPFHKVSVALSPGETCRSLLSSAVKSQQPNNVISPLKRVSLDNLTKTVSVHNQDPRNLGSKSNNGWPVMTSSILRRECMESPGSTTFMRTSSFDAVLMNTFIHPSITTNILSSGSPICQRQQQIAKNVN
jgi:hypothetical protein